MILVIGSEGSMGARYRAILSYLGKKYRCLDINNKDQFDKMARDADSVIIASPTDTHVDYIRRLLPYKKPILCEKPICKDIPELEHLFQEIKQSGTPFRMMFQYSLMSEANRVGKTHYNYFKHGSDGLVWDCIQIIGLSRGPLELAQTSPIWTCVLNGKALRLSDMDAAYIAYVQYWFNHPSQNLDTLLAMHEKTAMLERTGFYV